jgi:chromosome segregation ATPase
MAEKARDSLEKRARRAMLQHAFFRPESAVVIALTLLLAAFGPDVIGIMPAWGWLLAGAAAELAIVYSSYSDPETGRKVVAEMLNDEFEPEQLSDPQLQQQVEEALDYRARINLAIRERRPSVLRDNLADTASQIDEWLENIYSLAKRLDRFKREKSILVRDTNRATSRIDQLNRRLKNEDDPAVQRQINETISGMRRQIETINTLEKTMQRAELQLETTMTALGTIYSQTMLVGAKDIDSGRAKRLRQDIDSEVSELGDVLLAMDEVYANGSQA